MSTWALYICSYSYCFLDEASTIPASIFPVGTMRRFLSPFVPLTAGLPPLKEWFARPYLLPLMGRPCRADELLPDSLSGISPCFATLNEVWCLLVLRSNLTYLMLQQSRGLLCDRFDLLIDFWLRAPLLERRFSLLSTDINRLADVGL